MTVLCGGGASSPKTGQSAALIVGSGYAIQLLEDSGNPFLIAAAPFVPLATLALNAFCATDPPAQPTFTLAETSAILSLQFGDDFNAGISKLSDLIQNLLWYQVCQCDTAAQPTPPAALTPPAGTPLVISGADTRCSEQRNGSNTIGAADGAFHLQDSANWTSLLALGGAVPFSGTPHAVELDLHVAHVGGTPTTYGFRWEWCAGSFGASPISHIDYSVASGTHHVVRLTIPPTAISYNVYTSHTTTPTSDNPISGVTLYCGSGVQGPESPCCPPDSFTASLIQQLIGQVNLIQRQAVPFGYVPSTVHTALSGAGSISVSDLIGVLVDITTDPSSLGVEGTSPAELFDRGWITWGTDDGYPQSIRLTRRHQVSFPARAGLFTTVAYDLHPGVVVTITELLREP